MSDAKELEKLVEQYQKAKKEAEETVSKAAEQVDKTRQEQAE